MSFELQQQIRYNSEKLTEYLKDLYSWEDEIKKKDESLRKKSKDVSNKKLPPVRGTSTVETKPTTVHIQEVGKEDGGSAEQKPAKTEKKAIKPRTYQDYSQWDKFDVDKVLEEMDKEEEESAQQRHRAKIEAERQKQAEANQKQQQIEKEALELKEKGNEFYKKKDYPSAIEFYTKSLKVNPKSATVLANRAVAYLYLKKYAECERDSTNAIAIDNKSMKAYLWRASARRELGKYADAIKDFEQVLVLDPQYKQAKQEIQKLQELLKQQAEPKKKRYVIEEVEETEETAAPAPTSNNEAETKPAPKPTPTTAQATVTLQKEAPTTTKAEPAPKQEEEDEDVEELVTPHARKMELIDAMHKQQQQKEQQQQQQQQPKAEPTQKPAQQPQPQQQPTQARKEEQATPPKAAVPTTTTTTTAPAPASPSPAPAPAPAAASTPKRAPQKETPVLPLPTIQASVPTTAPRTGYEFERVFTSFKGNLDMLHQYMKVIAPSSYPKLFKENLSSEMFTSFLAVIQKYYLADDDATANVPAAIEIMKGIASLSRFDMLLMFLTKEDKKVVEQVVKTIEAKQGSDNPDVKLLKQKYLLK